MYFATFAEKLDGGIMVTASHNPPDYNGMKFVREGVAPISGDTGLKDMRGADRARHACRPSRASPAPNARSTCTQEYLDHLLGYVDRSKLRKLKVVVNAGNGGAGLIIDKLEPHLPFEFIKVNHEPDGTSRTACRIRCSRRTARPRSRRCAAPAPTSASPGTATTTAASSSTSRAGSSRAITSSDCWPRSFSKRERGARIVHDPRLTWNTIDIVRSHGGEPVLCKSGHAFIKQKMREVDGVPTAAR